jgi:hypothetical protein
MYQNDLQQFEEFFMPSILYQLLPPIGHQLWP